METNKGKFLIAFDTICDGWQCATDDEGNPDPTLFDNREDAMRELFDDAVFMLSQKNGEELADCEVTAEQVAEMKKLLDEGDTQHMADFLKANPQCNYNDEFIVPAEEFIFGRKTIFTGKGVVISGKKLK